MTGLAPASGYDRGGLTLSWFISVGVIIRELSFKRLLFGKEIIMRCICANSFFILVLFAVFAFSGFVFAELPDVLRESFEYPEGSLGFQGDSTGGWGGAWEEVQTGFIYVIAADPGFGEIDKTGGYIEVIEAGTVYRDLAEVWPDDGSTYWLSMLYMRIDAIDVAESYNGFSLYGTHNGSADQELLYIGKPWGARTIGLHGHHEGSGEVGTSVDAYDGGWLVIKLEMSGDEELEKAYIWINPDPSAEPDTTASDTLAFWPGNDGFNRVRIGSGNAPNQCECIYDEIRLSQTFAGLTMPDTATAVHARNENMVSSFELYANYPNPFNPETTIRYSLDQSQKVHLGVYDVTGRKIKTLTNGIKPKGLHSVSWNGCDEKGRAVSSGVYVYKLISGKRTQARRMMLIR